jgi:predicted DsbA family dithiol-disulfide isomerase
MKEALFLGHFEERVDVGRVDAIVELAVRHETGVEPEGLRLALERGEHTAGVQADLALARSLGISGVPLFIANLDGIEAGTAVAVSGAQDLRVFEDFLADAGRRAASVATA